MLDMGFEQQIRTILENEDMPQRRDTVMVSATFPKTMQMLAGQFMSNYVFLSIGRAGATNDTIHQELYYVEE